MKWAASGGQLKQAYLREISREWFWMIIFSNASTLRFSCSSILHHANLFNARGQAHSKTVKRRPKQPEQSKKREAKGTKTFKDFFWKVVLWKKWSGIERERESELVREEVREGKAMSSRVKVENVSTEMTNSNKERRLDCRVLESLVSGAPWSESAKLKRRTFLFRQWHAE